MVGLHLVEEGWGEVLKKHLDLHTSVLLVGPSDYIYPISTVNFKICIELQLRGLKAISYHNMHLVIFVKPKYKTVLNH